jgi:hypothetical protein
MVIPEHMRRRVPSAEPWKNVSRACPRPNRSIAIASDVRYPLIVCWQAIPGRPGALGVERWLCAGTSLQVRSIHNRHRPDLQRVVGTLESSDPVRAIREMLQARADVSFGDWFEYTIGPPVMDLTAAPYGGARHSVETRMDGRIFARFLSRRRRW